MDPEYILQIEQTRFFDELQMQQEEKEESRTNSSLFIQLLAKGKKKKVFAQAGMYHKLQESLWELHFTFQSLTISNSLCFSLLFLTPLGFIFWRIAVIDFFFFSFIIVSGIRRSASEFWLSHLLTFQKKEKAAQVNVGEGCCIRASMLVWPYLCPRVERTGWIHHSPLLHYFGLVAKTLHIISASIWSDGWW